MPPIVDLSSLSVEQLNTLHTNIAGELAARAGEFIDLRYSAQPAGGALFCDRPAIGGDRNRDLWFSTLEAANAYLVRMAGDYAVTTRHNGTMYCDYTARGCSQSDMETCCYV